MTLIHAEEALALLGRTILVVEDDAVLGLDVVDRLESVGAEVLGPMTTVSEALEAIAGTRPIDAALVDAHLTDGSARRIIDALVARNTPYVLVTGDDNFGLVYSPDAPCVPKPADMRRVTRLLAGLLAPPPEQPG